MVFATCQTSLREFHEHFPPSCVFSVYLVSASTLKKFPGEVCQWHSMLLHINLFELCPLISLYIWPSWLFHSSWNSLPSSLCDHTFSCFSSGISGFSISVFFSDPLFLIHLLNACDLEEAEGWRQDSEPDSRASEPSFAGFILSNGWLHQPPPPLTRWMLWGQLFDLFEHWLSHA